MDPLITIFITQNLQRVFWKRQRKDELRLDAINEFNQLAAEYITGQCQTQVNFRPPTNEFRKAWEAMSAKLKALFSDSSFESFNKLDSVMGHNQLTTVQVSDFTKSRDIILSSLYSEIIPLRS